MIRNSVLILSILAIFGCASTDPIDLPSRSSPITIESVAIEEADGFLCDAASAQSNIGNKATAELAQRLLNITGGEVLRWIPPRTPVTRDYRNNRLNIYYDDAGSITQISCG